MTAADQQGIEVGIFVADLAVMSTFYADVFGLVPDGELQVPGAMMWPDRPDAGTLRIRRFGAGASAVKLVSVDPAATATNPPADTPATGLRYFSLRLSDLPAVVDRVRRHGGTVVLPVTEFRPGDHFALVCDPEGNQVELLSV